MQTQGCIITELHGMRHRRRRRIATTTASNAEQKQNRIRGFVPNPFQVPRVRVTEKALLTFSPLICLLVPSLNILYTRIEILVVKVHGPFEETLVYVA